MIKVMQKGFSPILVVIVVAAIALLGGGLFYVSRLTTPQPPTQEVTPKQKTPVPTIKETIKDDETSAWKIYTNQKFGFSLRYPNGWTVKENSSNSVWVSNMEDETLIIGVKNKADSVKITKSGTIITEDLTKRGDVKFLGQVVEKDVLVFQGNDMSVMYDQGREIPKGNLVFALSLDKTIVCPASLNAPCPKILTSASENIADKILSTFTLDQNQSSINLPQKEITGICDSEVRYKTQLQVQDDNSAQKVFQTYVDYMKINKLKDSNLAVDWLFTNAKYAGNYKNMRYWVITFSYSMESGEKGNAQIYANQNGEIVELRGCI